MAVAVASAERAHTADRTFNLLWLLLLRELKLSWLLFAREVRELLVSRALWAMVLISAPLVGFSFVSAVQLYSGTSQNAVRLPQLAANISPLDGIIVPTFGAVYLLNTFLLPFVAIRVIGNEKQTGALKLLLQMPIGPNRIVAIKLAALGVGWLVALIPTLSAILIWAVLLGGHLYLPELATVILGHALYAFVIAGFAFLAAALTESSATAAIVTLSFTLASWILEFAGNTSNGLVRAIASFSLSPSLRGLERGLLGSPTALTLLVLGLGFLALTVVWLPPGVSRTHKLIRTGAVAGIAAQALLLFIQLPLFMDVSEDRRNSFNPADERALRQMTKELKVTVNLATNDSRLRDLDRNVLSKLPRAAPHVTITYNETSSTSLLGGASAQNYGLNTYTYGGKQGSSRATTAREVLPLIHRLNGDTVVPDATAIYPGYPLITNASASAVWFYALLPILAVVGWWANQQAPAAAGAVSGLRVKRWGPLEPYMPALQKAVVLGGGALVLLQVVPYGRDHSNITVAAMPSALVQSCRDVIATTGIDSPMTLGQLRGHVNSMSVGLSSAVATADATSMRVGYGQFTTSFGAAFKEIAELYPGRCPRFNADRLVVETGLPQGDATARPGLLALQAGVQSLSRDLDGRIRQQSPDDLVSDQRSETDSPTVTGEPVWDSPRTQELATRSCAACHSNQPTWPWYANVAPLSWLVQHQVDDGRSVLNLSELDRVQLPTASGASVQAQHMPPGFAALIDGKLQLTDVERADLVRGLQATLAPLGK
ncbi:MAG TPA: heme-binding domain-containing protein [Chloroflexota bacterium]|nr:heme-binding domain-containing protein [Chloroflexota bacterium]